MSRRGQSILYVILLMPVVLLIFSLTVDIGQLQFQRLRVRNAADLATLSGAESVDGSYYARTGRLRLDPQIAIATTRSYLQRNLTDSLGPRQAASVMAGAQIVVINTVPARDPFTGSALDRPTVSARLRVPYRLNLLGYLGALGRGTLSLASNAQIRP